MLCVREALRQGTITQHTRCIFVESNVARALAIMNQAAQFDWTIKPYVHVGPISALNLQGLLGRIKIDYAFLDFCAVMTLPRAQWLHEQLEPQLSDGGSLALTFMRTARLNTLYRVAKRFFLSTRTGREEMLAAQAQLRRSVLVGTIDCGEAERRSPNVAIDRLGYRDVLDITRMEEEFGFKPVTHPPSAIMLGALQGLMPHRSYDLGACLEYKTSPGTNGARMGMLRLDNLRGQAKPQSQFIEKTQLRQLWTADDSHVSQR